MKHCDLHVSSPHLLEPLHLLLQACYPAQVTCDHIQLLVVNSVLWGAGFHVSCCCRAGACACRGVQTLQLLQAQSVPVTLSLGNQELLACGCQLLPHRALRAAEQSGQKGSLCSTEYLPDDAMLP